MEGTGLKVVFSFLKIKLMNTKLKYIITLAMVIPALLFSSCTKLDEEVYDVIPTDDFGNTQKEIDALVGPVYRTFKIWFCSDPWLLGENASDMSVTPTREGGDWWDGGQFWELRTHKWTPRTSVVRGAYMNTFERIQLCNRIYSTIDENESLSEEAKQKIFNEIRGVRAMWYYFLVDNFGSVPLVVDFKDNSLPVKKDRQEIYNFIISELNDIKDQLPSEVTSATYGKMTKGAAYTLLAKMYLNAEVWTGTPKWDEAIAACNEVMNLSYVLEPDWRSNFVTNNQSSKEIIFPVVYSSNDGGNYIMNRTLHYNDPVALGLNYGPWNGISAMPDFANSFDANDKRKEWSFLIGEMRNPATGQIIMTDKGRQLIHTPYFTFVPGTAKPETGGEWFDVYQEEGYRCLKWEFQKGTSADMENDFAIFRLADVYLMKAEALVRKNNGPVSEATDLVNEIRKRVFDPAKPLASATLNDIYNERRWELAWEGMGRQDQIRFGTFLQPITDGYGRVWKSQTTPAYRLVFPIPQQALDANPSLTPTEGYQ